MSAVAPDAPVSDDQARLDALAADLREARYYFDDVTSLLGAEAHGALGRDQTVPARIALAAVRASGAEGHERSLAVVVDLFLIGEAVPSEDVDAALPRTGAAGLAALGLADLPGGSAIARVDLRPHASDADAELWVASDLGSHRRTGVLRADHVLGIGQASLTLAQTTIRRPAARALDLGTGCGIQTFHLLAHAEHVTATDVSERALAFTRFNLLLNHAALGIDPANLGGRVDLRRGSLLEPVASERFDLIVSNPPFVITPRAPGEGERFTYRDGGLAGDRLVADLVSGLPGLLTPGGSAQLLANWEIRAEDEQWFDRPAAWLGRAAAADVDAEAWFIQRDVESPLQYAEVWLRDAAESRDPEHYRRRYADYLADFASRDVESIGFGMVWLRRPAGHDDGADVAARPVGRRFESIEHPIEQPLGPHLASAIAAADSLAAAGALGGTEDEADEALGRLHVVVADDVTEERHQRPGAEHPGVILLRQGAGLRRTSLLSTAEAGLVSACDGELSIGQIVSAIAALLGEDDPELEPTLLAGARRLILEGFLTQTVQRR
ncbi:DUF7059 domain-containing protein [Zhihengliuella halotolerans]|uniref:Methyltransferase family protein n=1 Tax=Zhihengliuella halotolerans TaxID=370736 RepID=A0A4Q8ADN1_9MICC|nr:methyltransferase [Zhihengliuella halotolerans]RZU62357.1 methyltransferase family protein [Zhihengliuella halotolerans]